MYGIEAITTHNGWIMAITGVIIVFAGLVVLSATIAQLHKILNFWENKTVYYQRRANGVPPNDTAGPPARGAKIPQNLVASVRSYKLITSRIGEPFSLPKLLQLAELSGLPRPHSTINDCIKAGVIVPDGKGFFFWQ